jgi:hypothetical protein
MEASQLDWKQRELEAKKLLTTRDLKKSDEQLKTSKKKEQLSNFYKILISIWKMCRLLMLKLENQ